MSDYPYASKPKRLLYLVSHPIPYQAPLLRYLSACDPINLHVCFHTDLSIGGYFDKGFACQVNWGVPLLEGYSYQFLSEKSLPHTFSAVALWKLLWRESYDIVWLHGYVTPCDFVTLLMAKCRGLKVLVRGESVSRFSEGSALRRFFRPLFFKILDHFVDTYLTIGTENRDFYRAQGVADSKLIPAPYTVDNDFFRVSAERCAEKKEELRSSLGLEAGRPIILYASKMQERKQTQDLLEAYIQLVAEKKLSTVPYLLFVGDGEKRAQLQERVVALHLETVLFLGFKNQTELPAYFNLCDVFVLPSVRENWGLIVNEVMNAGRAVIVSDEVGCAVDLVLPGENGMIYPARDITALKEALFQLLSDPKRLKKMGEKSLERIAQWGIAETAAGIIEACRQ